MRHLWITLIDNGLLRVLLLYFLYSDFNVDVPLLMVEAAWLGRNMNGTAPGLHNVWLELLRRIAW